MKESLLNMGSYETEAKQIGDSDGSAEVNMQQDLQTLLKKSLMKPLSKCMWTKIKLCGSLKSFKTFKINQNLDDF